MWQHWHEEEDKDVDDDGPVYVMNQKTAIGHGIARVSGCLSQNIRVRGLPSGLPLHLRLLHQVLGKNLTVGHLVVPVDVGDHALHVDLAVEPEIIHFIPWLPGSFPP